MAEQKQQVKSADVVRVTSLIVVGDKEYQPNTLVKNLPESSIKSLLGAGHISADAKGIEYCKDELKQEVIDHTKKPEPKQEKE